MKENEQAPDTGAPRKHTIHIVQISGDSLVQTLQLLWSAGQIDTTLPRVRVPSSEAGFTVSPSAAALLIRGACGKGVWVCDGQSSDLTFIPDSVVSPFWRERFPEDLNVAYENLQLDCEALVLLVDPIRLSTEQGVSKEFHGLRISMCEDSLAAFPLAYVEDQSGG
ncbi:MAG: hypothetical protein EOP84_09980 [Verrucomicrobiaceae bacterium]|nr:MAG: hypothetical protein EOP84_09980 [Verrucomicrobiaceae bacterium]